MVIKGQKKVYDALQMINDGQTLIYKRLGKQWLRMFNQDSRGLTRATNGSSWLAMTQND